MKAIIKGTNKEVYVTYDETLGMYVDDDKPYIKYLKEDIEKVVPIYVDKDQRNEMVRKIMNEFDFDKVHKVMSMLKWTYWYSNGQTPTIKMLKDTALGCLNDIKYQNEYSFSATGGFKASFQPCDSGDYLVLAFEVTNIEISTNEIKIF